MKKKLLVLVVALVLTAILLVLTACNGTGMFVKDETRDYAQISADVTYAGRNTKISKLELFVQVFQNFNSNYNYYNQYGYGTAYAQSFYSQIDEVFDQTNKNMSEDEAYTLKCLDALYELAAKKDASVASVSTKGQAYDATARTKEIEKVLEIVSKKDLITAVENYNSAMQSDFDSLRSTYEKDKERSIAARSSEGATKIEITQEPYVTEYEVDDTLDTRGLIVSATYSVDGKEEVVVLDDRDYTVKGFSSSSVAKDQEITVTFDDLTATFTVDIVAKKPSRTAKEKDEEDEKTEVPARFETELVKKIEAARSEDLAEYKLLLAVKSRLENSLSENHTSYDFWYLRYLKQQVVTCYEEIVKEEAKKTVTDAEIQAEYDRLKAEQDAAIVEKGVDGYVSAVGESARTQIVHDGEENYFYVYNLLFKMDEDEKITTQYNNRKNTNVVNEQALEEYLKKLRDQFEVYISNPEYDADAECEEENCPCTLCDNYTGENPGVCTNEECPCVECKNARFMNKWFAEKYGVERNENGTINVRDVMTVIQGELGELGVNATAEERLAVLQAFVDFGYLCNDDSGAFEAYAGDTLGYGLGATKSSYVTEFTALARALAYGTDDLSKIEEWEIKGAGVGSYGWCYTSYGIHFIMLAGYAFPEAYKVEANLLASGNYALPLDAVVDRMAYDAETGEGTLAYYIAEDLKEKKATDALNAFQQKFYHNELSNASISYNSKVYQDLVKKYKVESEE